MNVRQLIDALNALPFRFNEYEVYFESEITSDGTPEGKAMQIYERTGSCLDPYVATPHEPGKVVIIGETLTNQLEDSDGA